jgi:hypothetical protein
LHLFIEGKIMKQSFGKKLVVILVGILSSHTAVATQLVSGYASAPLTFDADITSKVYDRASASLYVGLGTRPTDNLTYLLSKATRPIGAEFPKFTGIASQDLQDAIDHIQLLTLATYQGNPYPDLACTAFSTGDASQQDKRIFVTTWDGASFGVTPAELKDADAQITSSIATIAGMLYCCTTHGYIFAAVSPAETSVGHPISFGLPGSGIAVICLQNNTSLYQTAADAADPAIIKAKKFDQTISEIEINTAPTFNDGFATMYWDQYLQRLYIGLQLTTGAASGDGAKAVVVGQVNDDCNETLTLRSIVDNNAIEPTAGPPGTNIVAAITTGASIDIDVIHVRAMHCSTGPSYLIVNGNDAETHGNNNNYIFALPIVDTPDNPTIHGTLANKNDALVHFKFVTPATQQGELVTENDDAALVGAMTLPIQSTTTISDIEVIGDTVFVSTATGAGENNDNGIIYSQALFDQTGKIVRWTPWAKRAYPFNDFCMASCVNNGIKYFAVDAVTGKIWAVDGQTQKVVHVTQWDKGATCPQECYSCGTSSPACCTQTRGCCQHPASCTTQQTVATVCPNLPAHLNNSLYDGCYSALDLDQATHGFTLETGGNNAMLSRFALFGGVGKVVFARTSTAYTAYINSPQQVIEDFDDHANYLETVLPDYKVCVKVLEYSRTNDQNNSYVYFFAGTDLGLYIYAKEDGRGFSLDEMNLYGTTADDSLNYGKWHAIEEFQDPIIDIKSTGLALYVASQKVTCSTMVSTITRLDFQSTITEMLANQYTIATSGVTPFGSAPAFFGIQPVATGFEAGYPLEIRAEQLLLATNNGLFGSYADQVALAGIASAQSQSQAAWARVPKNNNTMFAGIAGIDTPIPSTVWPMSVEDQCNICTFERSSIYQISSRAYNEPADDPFFTGFIPKFFNAQEKTEAFATLDPITYFWSDGARRFFIINRQQDRQTINRLMSFPFNTKEWRVCIPDQQVLLFDPYVAATQRFFWVKQIGYTGILMAGTNNGVIALE